jgi:hypothetical protein
MNLIPPVPSLTLGPATLLGHLEDGYARAAFRPERPQLGAVLSAIQSLPRDERIPQRAWETLATRGLIPESWITRTWRFGTAARRPLLEGESFPSTWNLLIGLASDPRGVETAERLLQECRIWTEEYGSLQMEPAWISLPVPLRGRANSEKSDVNFGFLVFDGDFTESFRLNALAAMGRGESTDRFPGNILNTGIAHFYGEEAVSRMDRIRDHHIFEKLTPQMREYSGPETLIEDDLYAGLEAFLEHEFLRTHLPDLKVSESDLRAYVLESAGSLNFPDSWGRLEREVRRAGILDKRLGEIPNPHAPLHSPEGLFARGYFPIMYQMDPDDALFTGVGWGLALLMTDVTDEEKRAALSA